MVANCIDLFFHIMVHTYLLRVDRSNFYYTFPEDHGQCKRMKMRYCAYKAPASDLSELVLLNFSLGAPKKYNGNYYTYLVTSIPDQKIIQESQDDDWVCINFRMNMNITVLNEKGELLNNNNLNMNPLFIEIVFE